MVATLSLAGSSYLAPFLQLKEQIQQEAAAAQDNVRFLACLEGPCQALSKATAPQIPGLLPQILDCIRMIWSLSRFYNTLERISGLLRRLSNEVINRCCAALRLGDIFSGDVMGPLEVLQQSMAAGAATAYCTVYSELDVLCERHQMLLSLLDSCLHINSCKVQWSTCSSFMFILGVCIANWS
jgi:hypothetical protein